MVVKDNNMAKSDKHQSAKQYNERKKRINRKNRYDTHITKVSNEITDLNTQIERLEQLKKEKLEERNVIEENELSDLMNQYNNKELLEDIFNLAKKTTFSTTTIFEIENKCQNGINEDNITLEDINTIYQIEMKINMEIPKTNAITDLMDNFGNNLDLEKEREEKTNGN